MTAEPKHKFTLEEYFALELDSEENFEYWDGEIWTMPNAGDPHNKIILNIHNGLSYISKLDNCFIFPSATKIQVPVRPPYRYADLSGLCGRPDIARIGELEVLNNPQMIIEVLSDWTTGFDRGDKFSYYKSIPSFIEYLVVAHHRPLVSQFIKQSENVWTNIDYTDLEATVELVFTDCRLMLSEIYRDVVFEPQLEIVGRNNEPTNAF